MTELSNRGILKLAQGKVAIRSIPLPKLRDGYLLVKTIAVAINPADWQTVDEPHSEGHPPTLLGHDASGVVVAVGKDVTKIWNIGDRVAGMVHGGNEMEPEDGSFAEYIVIKADIAIRIPENLGFDEAAVLSGALATIAMSMYSKNALHMPLLEFPLVERETGSERFLLIYGGSTAMGTMATQCAKLSGYTVIATASPANFDLVKDYGADHLFDYHDPDCGKLIRELTKNKLIYAFDCIAVPTSAKICAEALSSSPPPKCAMYVNLMGIDISRHDIESYFPLGYTVVGEEFMYEGSVWSAQPKDFELTKKFVSVAEDLLGAGLIKPHPVDLRKGGLDGILSGMQDLKDGKVSGAKLVYRVSEV